MCPTILSCDLVINILWYGFKGCYNIICDHGIRHKEPSCNMEILEGKDCRGCGSRESQVLVNDERGVEGV